jgi:hypothetical protein
VTLGAGNILQSNSGNNSANEAICTVTLASATTGHTVLIGVSFGAAVGGVNPTGFTQDAHTAAAAGVDYYVYRKQVSTGETSWSVSMSASTPAAWWVLEVSGLDPSPFVTGIADGGQAGTTADTGTTSTVTQTDILCLAALQSYNSGNATITWSGYTNSFTEIKDQSTASAGSTETSVAVAYKFPGVGGTFITTATLSASAIASGAMLVYKAAPPPAVSMDNVTVGGSFNMTATVTLRDGSGTHLNLFTGDTTVQGAITIATGAAPAVTGNMTNSTSTTPVTSSGQTFTVGQIVSSNLTGEVMVVRDSWIDAGGAKWSNTTNRGNIYSTAGWSVIGTAVLN